MTIALAGLCAKAGLDRELKAFEKGAEQGALSLMAAFYFKQTRRTGERTFEFTHKTFGEYLAACGLVDAVTEIERDRADRRARRRSWDEEAALADWIRSTGPAPMDTDLLAFVQRQVDLEKQEANAAQPGSGTDLVDRWRSTLAELFSHQLNVGLPMERVPLTDNPELTRFREMTRQAHNAEEALLAAHACAAYTIEKSSRIDWANSYALRDLLSRLGQRRPDLVARACLCWLDRVEGNDRHALFRADLSNAGLLGTNLTGADLRGANLLVANLLVANLLGADLRGANLKWADLERADFRGTNLFGANLRGADLERANLARANLAGANLRGVKHLDQARNLDRVKSWRGARIERKWVERLELDARKLGLVVVDDVPDHADLEPAPNLPDQAAP